MAMEKASAGEPQIIDYRVNKSDAVQVWVESRCQPVTDGNGEVVSLVGSSHDITDRKMYQRELLDKVGQLEEFASTVAHDIRNPLNVADGHIRLAATEYESDHLQTGIEAIERIDTLVEELLSLARLGESIDDLETVSFSELMTAGYDHVRAPGCSLTMTGDMSLECDPSRLVEAFENLVRNAVEHGHSEMELTAGVLETEDGVFIEDEGPGIPVDKQETIFERGYTTREDGSGFGLAIVRRIIEAHGWSIDVTRGTTGSACFEILTQET